MIQSSTLTVQNMQVLHGASACFVLTVLEMFETVFWLPVGSMKNS